MNQVYGYITKSKMNKKIVYSQQTLNITILISENSKDTMGRWSDRRRDYKLDWQTEEGHENFGKQ